MKLHFILCRPWRDYYKLRTCTRRLRNRGACDFSVAVINSTWLAVPDRDVHKALTVAAIINENLNIHYPEEGTRRILVEHGCRGLVFHVNLVEC